MTQITLSPSPADLGIYSCGLGPWFTDSSISLPPPSGTSLALSITIPSGTDWLPPTSGLSSFHIAAAAPPRELAGLRDPAGLSPFAANSVVALFRILAEAEERLHGLMKYIPLPTASPLSSSVDFSTLTAQSEPSRARVRTIALEMTPGADGVATLNNLLGMLSPAMPSSLTTDADHATYLGFTLDGTTLNNGSYDVADLKRAGQFDFNGSARRDVLLHFAGSTTAKLHVFDAAGRALDPGAVACWWTFLTTAIANLWAKGITATADKRIISVDSGDHLLAQVVNAHEGPPSGPIFDNRLNVTNAATGTGALRNRGTSGALTFAFTAAPAAGTTDNAPIPRVALLPKGTYGSSVALWPSGSLHTTLTRDHVRVAIVDVERHVTGVPRLSTDAATTPPGRRVAQQAKDSMRIRVEKLASPASTSTPFGLLPTIDRANRAILDVFGGTGAATLITSVAERDFGVIDVTLPGGTLLDALPLMDPIPAGTAVTHDGRVVGAVRAVGGSGQVTGPTVANQRVAIDLNFGPSNDAVVRAWTYGLDHRTGIHFRLNGATARSRPGDHGITILLPLPDGSVATPAQMSLDLLMVTSAGTRFFADLRFTRPSPDPAAMLAATGTAPIALGSFTGDVLICETGEVISPIDLTARIPPGANLIGRSGATYTLVDRTTLPERAFVPATLVRTLAAGDSLVLTQPAFSTQPAGDTAATLGVSGATVTRSLRHDALPGTPLATMERLEVAAARITSTEALAAIATSRSLGTVHEILPNANGHPGAPAAVETHGTGVALTGDAAVALAEITRDRDKFFLPDLFIAALTPLTAPTSSTPSTLWAATLRTVASGVEEIPPFPDSIVQIPSLFPFGDILPNLEHWIQTRQIPTSGLSGAVATAVGAINSALQSATIPSSVANPAKSVARALDRRIIAGAYGMKETAVAVKAAFERAEDFVYLETPAIDLLNIIEGPTSAPLEQLGVVNALVARLAARPGLRLLICVPVHHISEVGLVAAARDNLLRDALEAFNGVSNAASRVVFFSPASGPGRTLRLSSTTVIADDAFLVTGSTHLWRRGFSFDSSLAASLFDEEVTNGRPRAILDFRRLLIANRLGVDPLTVPDDPIGLLEAVRLFVQRGGGTKLAIPSIERPDPAPTATDNDARNPDGSPNPTLRVSAWLAALGVLESPATEVPNP